MSFTVARHGGTDEDTFSHYLRLLRKQGLKIEQLTRVPEPGTQSRWLHVWPTREAAERFRDDLAKESREKTWYVHKLTEDEEKHVTEGPLGPLVISVGIQTDGWAFGLDPWSRILIDAKHPEATQLDQVFVAFKDARKNGLPGSSPEKLFVQIACLLTGLTNEELERFGGYRFLHPTKESDRELFKHTLIH